MREDVIGVCIIKISTVKVSNVVLFLQCHLIVKMTLDKSQNVITLDLERTLK